MAGREAFSCVLKWVGTTLCVLTVAVWTASLGLAVRTTVGHFLIALYGGGIGFSYWDSPISPLFEVFRPEPVKWLPRVGLRPRGIPGFVFGAFVPLWCIFPFVALPTVFLWWRDRRRPPADVCQNCGYDLTGNVSGRCPECGEDVGGARR